MVYLYKLQSTRCFSYKDYVKLPRNSGCRQFSKYSISHLTYCFDGLRCLVPVCPPSDQRSVISDLCGVRLRWQCLSLVKNIPIKMQSTYAHIYINLIYRLDMDTRRWWCVRCGRLFDRDREIRGYKCIKIVSVSIKESYVRKHRMKDLVTELSLKDMELSFILT